jgi:hypothetical protein
MAFWCAEARPEIGLAFQRLAERHLSVEFRDSQESQPSDDFLVQLRRESLPKEPFTVAAVNGGRVVEPRLISDVQAS